MSNKWKEAIKGSYIEGFFKKPQDYAFMKTASGYRNWRVDFLKNCGIDKFLINPVQLSEKNSQMKVNEDLNIQKVLVLFENITKNFSYRKNIILN